MRTGSLRSYMYFPCVEWRIIYQVYPAPIMRTDVTVVFVYGTLLNYFIFYFVCLFLFFLFCFIFIVVPRLFEEKRKDTVFGFPWCVARGAWCVVVARCAWHLVPLTPPTVFVRSFWNFTGVEKMVWKYACGVFRIMKLFFITFYTFWT